MPSPAAAEPTHAAMHSPARSALISHRFETVDGCPVIVDRQTRLMWQRCSVGQAWNGETCTGRPDRLEWDSAAGRHDRQCGFDDWHLPERVDLEVLLVEGGIPAIDLAAFPNTPPASYWSASTSVANPHQAWYVNFGRGSAQQVFKDARFHVRLVRELR